MTYAIVDFYRLNVARDFAPGGVSVLLPSGAWTSRYDPADSATEANLRFRAAIRMVQDATNEGMPPVDAITRIGRSGFSGHFSWQVGIKVPERTGLGALYDHYIEKGLTTPFPDSEPLELANLPFG